LSLQFDPVYENALLQERVRGICSGEVSGTDRIESSDYAAVYRFEAPFAEVTKLFYYKEFHFRNVRDRLSVFIRRSRARRAWRGSRLLLQHGIGAAFPVCLGEERSFGVVIRNFLITEAVPDALEVHDFLTKHFAPSDDSKRIREKRTFLKLLGRFIGRMHRLQIFQGDLRARNVLIRQADTPEPVLLDNERTRQYRRLPDRHRLKNLVQLNMILSPALTRSDRLRFFAAYLEENPGLLPARKEWMRKILGKTRSRLFGKGYLRA
jgi:tRNA A-37 threonylcarbamoyl transferase component Bud32